MKYELINRQISTILKKMVDLYLMFTVPAYIISTEPNKITYKPYWTNEDAKRLYQNHETMLKTLKETYEIKAAQDRQFNREKDINGNDRKYKIP